MFEFPSTGEPSLTPVLGSHKFPFIPVESSGEGEVEDGQLIDEIDDILLNELDLDAVIANAQALKSGPLPEVAHINSDFPPLLAEEVLPKTQDIRAEEAGKAVGELRHEDKQGFDSTQQEAKRLRGEPKPQNQKFKGQWVQLFADNRKPCENYKLRTLEKKARGSCIDFSGEEATTLLDEPHNVLLVTFPDSIPGMMR
ncbi:hypothetical protein Dimus_016841 [Dionaea muscipula]